MWRRYQIEGQPAPLLFCVMATVPANDLIRRTIKTGEDDPRMPAILEDGAWTTWLGEDGAPPASAKALLRTMEGVNWTSAPEPKTPRLVLAADRLIGTYGRLQRVGGRIRLVGAGEQGGGFCRLAVLLQQGHEIHGDQSVVGTGDEQRLPRGLRFRHLSRAGRPPGVLAQIGGGLRLDRSGQGGGNQECEAERSQAVAPPVASRPVFVSRCHVIAPWWWDQPSGERMMGACLQLS